MEILLILFVGMIFGLIPAFVAESKGKSFAAWWFYGTMLFIIALPHAILMNPDRGRSEREQLESGESRKCPFCAEIIKIEARVCRYCGRDLPAVSGESESAATQRLIDALERNRKAGDLTK